MERGKQLYASMGLDASRAQLIGDTDHVFEVGRALGTPTLLLADGHQSYERLQRLACTVLPSIGTINAVFAEFQRYPAPSHSAV